MAVSCLVGALTPQCSKILQGRRWEASFSHSVVFCSHSTGRLNRRLLLGLAGVALSHTFEASQTSTRTLAIPLAPLGKPKRIGGEKLTGLPVDGIKEILREDLSERQYFVTGDLTPEIFADDCRFKDPTNDISGLSRYVQALKVLFDPNSSQVVLKSIQVTGPQTIQASWTLGGYLRFPWKPRVDTFEGVTVYSLNSQGLIQTQEQQWSISGLTALVESFTPTRGPMRD